jgi:5-epi-alpha-selinene synthase
MSIDGRDSTEVNAFNLRARLALSTRTTTPILYCPFPSRVNPSAALIDQRTVDWAWSVGLVDESRATRLRGSRIGWLASRAFPDAQVFPLQLAADWTTLFCLLDDGTEKIDEPLQLERYLTTMLEIFSGKVVPDVDDEMGQAFEDLGRRMREETPPEWLAGFTARLVELFQGFQAEANGRAQMLIPRLEEYLKIREVTVGLYVEFEFGALTNGIMVPRSVQQNLIFKRLVQHACNIVGWANDIYTYKKEIMAGEVHNLIVVAMRERGLSLDEAVDWAVDLHDTETRLFERLLGKLPSFGPEIDAQVVAYAGMLTAWVRGHLDWAHETGRYVTADGNPPSSKRWQSFMAAQMQAGTMPFSDVQVPSSRRMSLSSLADALMPNDSAIPSSKRMSLASLAEALMPPPDSNPESEPSRSSRSSVVD